MYISVIHLGARVYISVIHLGALHLYIHTDSEVRGNSLFITRC